MRKGLENGEDFHVCQFFGGCGEIKYISPFIRRIIQVGGRI